MLCTSVGLTFVEWKIQDWQYTVKGLAHPFFQRIKMYINEWDLYFSLFF